jgi:hypothetical protein
MSWLLDTNVFVQAGRREYGLDFCPAFWDWLIEANAAGRVHSIDKVLSELVPGDDVAEWAAARPLGVTYASPYEMLRRERARFVLGRST